MIHIEENKLTITIEGQFIEDTYATMVVQLIDLLGSVNPKLNTPSDEYYEVYNLLKEMMPDYKQIKAISGINPTV